MGTPDGRKGWADYFVEQGYVVYVMDQPMRGRSAVHPSDGPTAIFTPRDNETRFTAIETEASYPQAKLHTQWPGEGPKKGRKGDPVFDAWYASLVESISDLVESSIRTRDAGAALLDRIGPAILVTHSQSGPFGWLIADERPNLVKAILAIEPIGPPFEVVLPRPGKGREWGLTSIAITYDPPIKGASELAVQREARPDGPDLVTCIMQAAPARQLVNLKKIPVMLMIAEASEMSVYDHCTAKYLNQAGVKTELIRLADRGIHGNGHVMMVEKNNLDIARLIDDWVVKNVKERSGAAAPGHPRRGTR
jgi:pimeloyl-ACP methyl ester carboxylesterase